MNDQRRIGKTMILRKMESNPPDKWIAIYQDLEGYSTAEEFAMGTYQIAQDNLNPVRRSLNRIQEFFKSIGGTEVAGIVKLPDGVRPPWKEVLTRTFSELQDELTALDCRLVFMWDELPFLLGKVQDKEGANVPWIFWTSFGP